MLDDVGDCEVFSVRSLTARCYDSLGDCFARRDGRCEILTQGLVPCPFKKPIREITRGIYYPYNPLACMQSNKPAKEEYYDGA